MLPIFPSLTDGENRLYGLFVDGQLVSTAGYSVFSHHFVMLGRLRSDKRYRGQNHATTILDYTKQQALQVPNVEFVGANTEKHNKPAQKVLSKIGLPHVVTLYGAKAVDLSSFLSEEAEEWYLLSDLGRKREWLKRTYLNETFPKKVFPFEAYYPFPISENLFTDALLTKWSFYENKDQTRFVILTEEDKGDHYLHVIYPWRDFIEQPNLWKTIDSFFEAVKETLPDTVIWMDFTNEEAAFLPATHPFELSSPWMLHGISSEATNESIDTASVESKLSEAYRSIDDLEEELAALHTELDQKLNKTTTLEETLSHIDSDLEK
nr:GNAT family N-acetyltransferase [Marinilactibacillus kalidii]